MRGINNQSVSFLNPLTPTAAPPLASLSPVGEGVNGTVVSLSPYPSVQFIFSFPKHARHIRARFKIKVFKDTLRGCEHNTGGPLALCQSGRKSLADHHGILLNKSSSAE